MFVNHTDVRMAPTKIRGGLNLVYNLYEMNGWETKSDLSIDLQQSLDPFRLLLPVDVPSSSSTVDGGTDAKFPKNGNLYIFRKIWKTICL